MPGKQELPVLAILTSKNAGDPRRELRAAINPEATTAPVGV